MKGLLKVATVFLLVSVGTPGTDTIQTAFVQFKELGEVQVEAEEPIGEMPRLLFTDARTGRPLPLLAIGRSDPRMFTKITPDADYPRLRFKVLNVAGLPEPLLSAVVMMPGGSDCGYEPVPIGAIRGRLRPLLPTPITFTTQDGFALGELGNGRGKGFALINYDFDPSERHYQAHRYTVHFYKWNQHRGAFESAGKYTTTNKTDAVGAGTEAGIPQPQIVGREKLLTWFPDFGC
jgi:hypothetical protein